MKNTYMTGAAQPRQPRADNVEAAGWLATVARRYANENANAREVEEAFRSWQAAHAASSIKAPAN
jgi:hypothetical protein